MDVRVKIGKIWDKLAKNREKLGKFGKKCDFLKTTIFHHFVIRLLRYCFYVLCSFQARLFQFSDVPELPPIFVTGKRVRVLHGARANHWQKEEIMLL